MVRSLLFLLLFASTGHAQIYNRLVQVNIGVSSEQFSFEEDISNFNDTSSHAFDFVSKSPLISYTHTLIFGDKFALAGKLGFQYLNIFYDNKYYGSPFTYISINPTLTIFYKKRFEYYVRLNVGATFWFNQPEPLPNVARRVFPEKVSAITGITVGGFNYFVTDKLGLNLELSIWSPELLTFGLNYRFHRGEKPTIQKMQEI
ncbi:hypothetical protein N8987_05145 [Crocinitomix sp.]|nr:hypothetical protein [Crocinitomix sp.]